MHQQARCGDERAGGDNEHPDAIHSRTDDLHELSKIFHERLTCRKARRFSTLFAGTSAQTCSVMTSFYPGCHVLDRIRHNSPLKIRNRTEASRDCAR
jgi:hypothetical protein